MTKPGTGRTSPTNPAPIIQMSKKLISLKRKTSQKLAGWKPALQKEKGRFGKRPLQQHGFELVAGDGFGGGFVGRSRGDVDRLVGVGEVGRNCFGDVRDGADLDDRGLRLLENEFFVDGANLGGFFPRLL